MELHCWLQMLLDLSIVFTSERFVKRDTDCTFDKYLSVSAFANTKPDPTKPVRDAQAQAHVLV